MIQNLVKKVFGSRSDREVKQLYPLVDDINRLAEGFIDQSDKELKERSQELRATVIEAIEVAKAKAEKDIIDKDEAKKFILLEKISN